MYDNQNYQSNRPVVVNNDFDDVYKAGYKQGSKQNFGRNLTKNLRRILWFSFEAALLLSIMKGCGLFHV